MGWFSSGPNINSRQAGLDIEYYAKCPDCREEYSNRKKSNVEYSLNKCAKAHKNEKEAAEKKESKRRAAQREKDEREERKEFLKEKNKREDERRQEALKADSKALQKKMAKSRSELRQAAKGKCPWCKQKPCVGTKRQCAMVKAAGLDSIMNTGDASDPATYDAQMKFYKENM